MVYCINMRDTYEGLCRGPGDCPVHLDGSRMDVTCEPMLSTVFENRMREIKRRLCAALRALQWSRSDESRSDESRSEGLREGRASVVPVGVLDEEAPA